MSHHLKEVSDSVGGIQVLLKKIETSVQLYSSDAIKSVDEQAAALANKRLLLKIEQLEKTNRGLQDVIKEREEATLKNLIVKLNEKEELKGIFPDDIERRIFALTKLVNQASKAYKEAQGFYDYIDIKIHNEFAYLGRAMSSIFIGLVKESFDYKDEDFHLAVEDASCSARHILNDCVDLLVAHAFNKRNHLQKFYPHISLTQVDKNEAEHWKILMQAQKMAAQTRYTRGRNRIDEYDHFIESESYGKLIDYCFDLKRIEDEMKTAVLAEIKRHESAIDIEKIKHKNNLDVKKIDVEEAKYTRRVLIVSIILSLLGGVSASKFYEYFIKSLS